MQTDRLNSSTVFLPGSIRSTGCGAEASVVECTADLDRSAERLDKSADFRVLRRILPRPVDPDLVVERDRGDRIGIVLDTETTGLDHDRDEVIETAMIRFVYRGSEIRGVVGTFEGLRQPSRPLSEEVSQLTGLTDEVLAGRSIDPAEVATFVAGVDLVVAHNAKFDRPFAENIHPVFRDLRWACSATEIPWRRLGVEGVKLGYVLTRYGRFHDGHRALSDCHALLDVLASPPPQGDRTAFDHLEQASTRSTAVISAVGAPFAGKSWLKARGYRWHPGSDACPKCWRIEVSVANLDFELQVLRSEVYRRGADIPVDFQDARSRFRRESNSASAR